MKTLIFNGSPRKNGGTATLIKELTSHLSGEITVIDSYRTNISPCTDCRHCWTNKKCAIKDEMQLVYRLIDEADIIIIASPIYFGEITGSLLGLMSRLQYYYIARKFRNTEMLSKKRRNGALILVDGGDGYVDNAMSMGQSLLRKMKSEFIGSVYFSGTENVPKNDTVVPEHILAEIKELSINLSQIPKAETDEERRARIYPVILSEYNPVWPEWYAEEKANVERLVEIENIARISHIGSTAVPGLTAKPTIDILLEISEAADIDKLITSLSSLYYIYLKEESAPTILTPPLHLMFLKGYLSDGFAEKVYHIHVVRHGDWDERLLFRDYLIAHPEAAAEYAALKQKLFENFEHDRDGYTAAKGAFIKEITDKVKILAHYDALIDENNDPIHDPAPLKAHMDKWDGSVFIEALQLTPDKSVLEIGVGTGRLAMRVCGNCGRFIGLDLSSKTIKRAKENLRCFSNAELLCGDFLTYDFPGRFDIIYSSLTFVHIEDKLAAIQKVASLLNDGGRFVLSVSKSQDRVMDMKNRQVPLYPATQEKIASLLNEAGLAIEQQFETEFAVIFAVRKEGSR